MERPSQSRGVPGQGGRAGVGKNKMVKTSLAALLLWVAMGSASSLNAGRFIATPFAETLPAGKYSLWQFGLYEAESTKKWRSLNRLDLGLVEGVELGVLVISPPHKPADTWINLQYRPVKEKGMAPSVSVGVWDAARKGPPWFSDKPAGPSPFVSLGKSISRGERYLKAGVSYGFNRLHGAFGGAEARFLGGTGLLAEYAPRNIRLPGTRAGNVGVYQWFGKSLRARASWMGGNPMLDAFFTRQFGT